jgi:hypothetical protein
LKQKVHELRRERKKWKNEELSVALRRETMWKGLGEGRAAYAVGGETGQSNSGPSTSAEERRRRGALSGAASLDVGVAKSGITRNDRVVWF